MMMMMMMMRGVVVHAFDLELPMEGINKAKAMVTSGGNLEAVGERHVNGELGTTKGATEEAM